MPFARTNCEARHFPRDGGVAPYPAPNQAERPPPVRSVPRDKSKDLMVSATGTWRVMPEPGAPKRERTTLPLALGVRCQATIESVLKAIDRAANSNQPSLLSLPQRPGNDGEVLRVRPAREPGFAVVSVERLDAAPVLPDPTLLANLFRLTPTETEIALDLLVTEELRDIATSRGVSIETVRMHVKSLLRKTGMSSQRRLAVLLNTLRVILNDTCFA